MTFPASTSGDARIGGSCRDARIGVSWPEATACGATVSATTGTAIAITCKRISFGRPHALASRRVHGHALDSLDLLHLCDWYLSVVVDKIFLYIRLGDKLLNLANTVLYLGHLYDLIHRHLPILNCVEILDFLHVLDLWNLNEALLLYLLRAMDHALLHDDLWHFDDLLLVLYLRRRRASDLTDLGFGHLDDALDDARFLHLLLSFLDDGLGHLHDLLDNVLWPHALDILSDGFLHKLLGSDPPVYDSRISVVDSLRALRALAKRTLEILPACRVAWPSGAR
mmetsp:Transcript_97584/g.276069  ORF Transcript_97584/g.276069 Transcript_97584/m.276069 type:complete len:282 (+) Transcript_97584:580-1425(+)